MRKILGTLLISSFFLIHSVVFSQKQITTFGLQFKPIISSEIINTGVQTNVVDGISFSIEPNQGYSFGMVVRKGFTKQLSLETGINFSRRNYNLSIRNDSNNFNGESDFSYVIYDIPILGLVYVQLGKDTYLNTAFGASLNFLPSDWDSFDFYFEHFSERRSWFVPSLLANIGFEYRTYDKGYFYLGFSYHRPFTHISRAGVLYKEDRVELARSFFDISGNYLTIDLRYFFHEPPEYRRKKK